MSDEREVIIDLIVQGWRLAENHFIATENDGWKWFMQELQNSLNLSEDEIRYVKESCYSMGV